MKADFAVILFILCILFEDRMGSRAVWWLVLASALAAGPAAAAPSESLVRQAVARTALAQVEQIDPRWVAQQRDCSGLVRFAYREAFKSLWPERLVRGPWQDRHGTASAFADAETLLAHNFAPLGRDEHAASGLRSGDLLAFRQGEMSDGPAAYHLMLVVTPDDKAHGDALVVYHPGEAGEEVRIGTLRGLFDDAPREWRPVAQNRSFVGFFRLKDWVTP